MSAPVDQRAFVLIATLWVMVILGVMLTHLTYQVRVESAVERWALNQSVLRWAARGAVHAAAARIREHASDDYHSPIDDWWSDEALFRDQAIGTARVSLLRPDNNVDADDAQFESRIEYGLGHAASRIEYSLEDEYGLDDEESRLNINVATASQLTGFAGVSTVLAESIERYRRERQEQQDSNPGGAGADTFSSDSARGDAADEGAALLVQGPIRTLRELLQVEGVTEELLFARRDERPPLATLLTTVSSGKVNVNSASEAVLTAVGLNERQVDTVLAQRDDTPYTSIEVLQQRISNDQERWERIAPFLDVRSTTFRLLARASLAEHRGTLHAQAILHAGPSALTFIRWREY